MIKENNRMVLLFPDGVGIRNYLYSDVFKNSPDNLLLYHAFDKSTEKTLREITAIKESYSIPDYNETTLEKFLRELICLSRLKYNTKQLGNPVIMTNWKKNHNVFFKQLFYKTIELASIVINRYSSIQKLEGYYQRAIRKTAFYNQVSQQLTKMKVNQLFCSHQRGLACPTIFAAAQDLGIKTTTVIFSWDNLPKARMALRAEQYLVWSPYMKKEMSLYYPEIDQDKIYITGTPQFECFQENKNIIPKEVFFATYNLDPNKKIICFSGDDVKTSPDDPKYLHDLAEEIIKSNLDNQYQILFRRCPVDVSGRYDEVLSKYPKLIKKAPPLWNFDKAQSWTTIYPLKEDISLLVSTAYYADVVVNVGSTMAFDFAMFQKPCIYINYDQENKEETSWSVNTIYQFQHFRSMPDKKAVFWWSNKEDITAILEQMKFHNAMQDWQSVILGEYQTSSQKLSNILNLLVCTSAS
ncbi:MAG: hypothetical protein V4497_06100 [Bacteroidota bacterium]